MCSCPRFKMPFLMPHLLKLIEVRMTVLWPGDDPAEKAGSDCKGLGEDVFPGCLGKKLTGHEHWWL